MTKTKAPGSKLKGTPTRRRIADLKQFPGNPRIADPEAIAESLEENGQFARIIVQAGTNYIMAGNHTVQAAQLLGWEEIDCEEFDVDDDRAKRINLAANKLGERGSYDPAKLFAMADSLDSLIGTGITDEELDDLAVSLEPPADLTRPVQVDDDDDEDDDDQLDDEGDGERKRRRDSDEMWSADAQRWVATRRQLVLDLPVSVFVWLADRLEEIGEAEGIDTNAEVVLHLAAQATGQQAPSIDGAPDEGDPEGDDDEAAPAEQGEG